MSLDRSIASSVLIALALTAAAVADDPHDAHDHAHAADPHAGHGHTDPLHFVHPLVTESPLPENEARLGYSYANLADGGGLSIPNRAFFNPEGSWDIENGGVPPDIDVEITPADFRAGRDPQLERAVEEALKRIASERRPVRKLPTTIP